MKSNKTLKGFTMIELIVVMAILGVLCGVLVPNGLAWLRDSKLKTCNSEAKVVFNAAVTVLQDYQLEGKVSEITTTDGIVAIEKDDSNAPEAASKITAKLGSNFGENSVWYVRANVSNVSNKNSNTIKVESALYADNNTSVCIGRYPVPANQYSNGGGFDTVKGSVSNVPTDADGDGTIDTSDAIYDNTKD
ncbi:MAG: type II secretion system GspH family protein [Ruminococcus sp.]|nr:type II secretion system GspH family protein [Ruminococcus sp.]MCD7800281.1 type II secretion system GspH family protein [Ruminococcus sp.]